ncbi:phosphotransferase enzyme family protein [Clostridium sediminicola]|uniref:phosphotransferase enzyme family protein n=1 Tax=Clostridium sediminicola TaxID=3114879 RepID=UPI003D186729
MNKDYFIFKDIVDKFVFVGEFIDVKPFGKGHINDTFEVHFKKENNLIHRYIIQRINIDVFKSPKNLMENIENVTNHLRKKIIEQGGDCNRETLNVIKTINGSNLYKSSEGDYWRSYIAIEGAKTYQVVENLDHFYNAGRALGKFQEMLLDFPVKTLHESIPDFHNTKKRYKDFLMAVSNDVMDRVKYIRNEIDFVMKRAEETDVLISLQKQGKLKTRVTHNDTKFNNVMIDDITGEGICILDLDTVMPGLSLYDFGDSIRSGANPAEEDERDLSKVCMDINLFESYTKGYLEVFGQALSKIELEHLPFSAKLMTFECGMRFLTDYINGDVYFKIHRKNHNLDRARTQFKMVEDMEEKFEEMKKIVNYLA